MTFAKPFSLDEIEGVWPAGPYRIETEEETLDGLSFIAYRRVSTHIFLGASNALRMEPIDPAELEAALQRDQAGA